MYQLGQCRRVPDVGRRRHHRVERLAPAIDADMRLYPEISLVPVLGLVHRRIARLGRVLGRTRRVAYKASAARGSDRLNHCCGKEMRRKRSGPTGERPLPGCG